MITQTIHCGFCGVESSQLVAEAAQELEPPDFDTRPGREIRATLPAWMQRCPNCGYCASDIATIHDGAVAMLGNEMYHRQLNDSAFPEKAREFLCHALILQQVGQFADAGWTSLHAAWACDDAGDLASSVACRKHALTLWERGKQSGQNFGDDTMLEYVLVTDLYRRSGQFEQAVVAASEALDSDDVKPPVVEAIFRREKSLAERRDDQAHSLSELS